MGKKIIITGGSGLLGTALSKRLVEKGYQVRHLSRSKSNAINYQTFVWDIENKHIEEGAFEDIDIIIHLAGAGVADKKWSSERKKILTSSRIDSTSLILDHLKAGNQQIESFISASAIGIYGFDTGGIAQTEERTLLGDDFLATLTKKWEEAADTFEEIGSRIVKLRIGLVLSKNGGILDKFVPLAKLGLSSAFGSGEQYMSWIHIDDLVNMFIMSLENQKVSGAYNAVAPNPVTNKDFLKQLGQVLNKPYFLPNTPKFVLKLALGELSSIITGGNLVSSKKIQDAGFQFNFGKLEEALKDLLN